MKKNTIVLTVCAAVSAIITIIIMDFTKIGLLGINALNGGYGLFDMQFFGYNCEKFYEIVKMMGSEGIKKHFTIHFIDYIFMLSYTVLMINISGVFLSVEKRKLAVVIPALLLVVDITENLLLDIAMLNYPTKIYPLVKAASAFTITKWVLTSLWAISFIVIIILWAVKRSKKGQQE